MALTENEQAFIKALALAMVRYSKPTYAVEITSSLNGVVSVDTDATDGNINLYVKAVSAGVIEYQLIDEGGAVYHQEVVQAGDIIEGHFKRFGANTTVFPLFGYGNLPNC